MGEEREKSKVEVGGRWKQRPVAARALVVGTAALPVATSILFALLVELLVPEPVGAFARTFWWIGLFGLSSVVFFLSERAARRALPLAILLELALFFPGEAPSRLSIAKRAYATRDVGRFLAEARSMTTDADPVIPGDSIVTLAAGKGARDRKTRRHSEHVRAIADLIGGELGLTHGDQDRLRWAVMLHDVGKLGARSKKQGPVPPSERDATRRHPFEGATLEAPLAPWLGAWGSAIAEHRERFDGAGYPFGLVGDEISLGGRIIAVADAYDSMTSVRSYKAPISQDAARAEIARRAGSQFDPTVVRAFLAIPVGRQPTLSPGTWLGMLPSGLDRFEGTAVYRVGTALLVLGSVLGLAAWATSPSHASAAGPSRTSDAATGPTSMVPTGGGPSSTTGSVSGRELQAATVPRSGSTSSSERSERARGAQSRSRTGSSAPAGTAGTTGQRTGSGAGGGSTPSSGDPKSPSTTSPPGTTPTTGSPPRTTPSTTGTPPTTWKRPPPPTTTTRPPPPPPPPPAAATGLTANASCKYVLIGPEISLHWIDSRSPSVTSYEILRSSDGVHYAVIAGVSARTTSFTDWGVDGLGITYWYKVMARSPDGSATSTAASATTPLTCL